MLLNVTLAVPTSQGTIFVAPGKWFLTPHSFQRPVSIVAFQQPWLISRFRKSLLLPGALALL